MQGTVYRKARHAGGWADDFARYGLTLTAELRILTDGAGLLTDHTERPAGTLELSIMGATLGYPRDGRRRPFESGGGQNRGDLDMVTDERPTGDPAPSLTADERAAVGVIWDRWHLNGMRSLCVHQGEAWTCRNLARHYPDPMPPGIHTGDPVLNGWPEIRRLFGEHPYPRRGDSCHRCGRNRWDEPADHCPVTGYRAGTAWLTEPLPDGVVADVLRIFGPADLRTWPQAADVPALRWSAAHA